MKSIFKLFSYKLIFSLPKNADFIIFSDHLHEYFFKYLDKKKCFIIKKKEIYIPVFLKVLNLRDIFDIHINYYTKLISLINPKIVLTFDSYNEQFYKFKNKINKNIKFLVCQKTPLFTEFRFFRQNKKFNSCDVIFSFGDLYNNKMKKYVDCKNVYNIGSFINNHNFKNINNEKKNLIILRTHSNFISKSEIKFLKNISKFIKEKKLKKYDILFKNKKNDELVFYLKKYLSYEELKSFNFIWRKGKNNFLAKNRSYKIANTYRNILFDRSSMGFEMLAKRKRVICLNFSKKIDEDFCLKNNKKFKVIHFNKNKTIKRETIYTVKNYEDFKKRLSQFDLKKNDNRLFLKTLPFDPGNSIFKQKLKSILKN